MRTELTNLDVANYLKYDNSVLLVHYNQQTFAITQETLQHIKSRGRATNALTCLMAAFQRDGKSKEEFLAFLEEAEATESNIDLEIVDPEQACQYLKSKEKTPEIIISDLTEIDLADYLKDDNSVLLVHYHQQTFAITQEVLQHIKSCGCSTDALTCLMAVFQRDSKSEEEFFAFLEEAEATENGFRLELIGGEEAGQYYESKEENLIKDTDLSSIDLADYAKEANADILIRYHTATIKIPQDLLLQLKSSGCPTDMLNIFMGAMLSNGKSEEEIKAFMDEAEADGSHFELELLEPDGEY